MRVRHLVATALLASAVAATPAMSADYTLPKAPGQYCKGVPKKKLPGQKKTQFAQCVTAVAKLNKNNNLSAKSACRGVPKKKRAGQRKTAFALCVAAANKARKDLRS